jgi:DNA-binding NarL/FixJ family response regulator
MILKRVVIVATHPVLERMIRLAAVAAGLDPVESAVIEDLHSMTAEPTIVVVDADAPDGSSLHPLHLLREPGRDVRSIVLCDRVDGRRALEALRLGASALVRKQDGLRELEAVLVRVAAGERVVPPELERTLVDELGRLARQARERSSVGSAITRREREILVLLADGFTTRQVGRRLGISPRTVETHVAKLYRKLAVSTRLQALARAASLGIIRLDA